MPVNILIHSVSSVQSYLKGEGDSNTIRHLTKSSCAPLRVRIKNSDLKDTCQSCQVQIIQVIFEVIFKVHNEPADDKLKKDLHKEKKKWFFKADEASVETFRDTMLFSARSLLAFPSSFSWGKTPLSSLSIHLSLHFHLSLLLFLFPCKPGLIVTSFSH